MKTIPNMVFPTQQKDGSNDTAAQFILDCLNAPPPGGMDFKVLRERLKVAALVEKVPDGANIELEDADFAIVLEAARSTRWLIVKPSLVKFAELLGL